jgi:predicted glycosyltransferase
LRVFLSPLDWGLGHAARCVPIISYLLDKKIEVIIGAEGSHLIFLKEHFPNIEYIDFPGYRISYSAKLPVGVKVLLQLPQMVSAIKKEHEFLKEIIQKNKIDAVISDNRYGLWNEKVPSVIITHQLNIQAPAGNKFLSKTACTYIKNFDECWIPDYEGKENLSGILSHPIPKGINGKYIGPLSRFGPHQPQTPKGALKRPHLTLSCEERVSKDYDLLAILSGPEPQRSKLEEIILKELNLLPLVKALIIQGLPGNEYKKSGSKNIQIFPHLNDTEFLEMVNNSALVLCRAGYSTLMDLNAIGWKKSIFIPTPGQTEQAYLGKLMQEKGLGIIFNQKGFSLKDALEKISQLKPLLPNLCKGNYKDMIDEWINRCAK